MRFDAYAGNVPGDRPLAEVAEVLGWALGGVVSRGRPVRRYGEVLQVKLGGHMAVWCGRDHGNDLIYFEGKGESSPQLVSAVRKHLPEHTVSRADVCEDYDEEGAFTRLVALCRKHKGDRTYGGFVKVSDNPQDGRTYEVSKRKDSAVYGRAYQAGLMRERLHLCRPNWARMEFECKPRSEHKAVAADLQPLQFLGMAAWSKRLAEALTTVEIPRLAAEYEAATFAGTNVYLARVFRRHWEESLAEGRDWACIGREFEDIWLADDQAKQASERARKGKP